MKKMPLLPVYILLSAALTISSANQPTRYVYTEKLDFSTPNFPSNYFDDNIYFDPRLNHYMLRNYNNFEPKKIPITDVKEEYMGVYGNKNEVYKGSPNVWRLYTVNGQEVPQINILNEPLVFPSRGFPISPVNLNIMKETMHEIPTEVPVNADDISFGPSASHVATAPKTIKYEKPPITFPNRNQNIENEQGHFYKTVEKIEPKKITEIASHTMKPIEDIPESTTAKVKLTTAKTIPPVPTLSPWIDGFGK